MSLFVVVFVLVVVVLVGIGCMGCGGRRVSGHLSSLSHHDAPQPKTADPLGRPPALGGVMAHRWGEATSLERGMGHRIVAVS